MVVWKRMWTAIFFSLWNYQRNSFLFAMIYTENTEMLTKSMCTLCWPHSSISCWISATESLFMCWVRNCVLREYCNLWVFIVQALDFVSNPGGHSHSSHWCVTTPALPPNFHPTSQHLLPPFLSNGSTHCPQNIVTRTVLMFQVPLYLGNPP